MKRPFSITEEPKRTILEKKICDFIRDNSKEVSVRVEDGYFKYTYHRFLFLCPCCKKEIYFTACEEYFTQEYKDNQITDYGAYWFGYDFIKNHLATQIRMHGKKNAMDLILKIFGRKYGKEVLLKLVRNNIIATKLICEYINKKFASVALSEGEKK